MATGVTMLGGAPLAWTWRRSRNRLVRRMTHVVVFGAFSGPRRLLRALAAGRLAAVGAQFDRDFYLAQAPPGAARARAARDPLLHYWLVGSRQGRLPHPAIGQPLGAPIEAGAAAERPTALIIDHGRGGGSSRLLARHAERMRGEGWRTVMPRRIGQETPLFVVAETGGWRAFDLFADEAALTEFARSAGVRRLVINHLIDLPQDAAAWLARFAGEIGAEYEVVLHDYYLACPRIDLIASDGRYCGLAPVERCRDCLAASGPALSGVDPKAWRERSAALLAEATRVIAPSRDLAERLGAEFPGARIEVEEPEDDTALPASAAPATLGPSEAMRVLILGALNRPKGLDVVLGLARALSRRRAPVRMAVLGPAADQAALRRVGVRVHGRFQHEELEGLLAAEAPHVVFFPAIWPETWSFALTEALRADAEVVAFDIGAIAQRLTRLGRGTVLDYSLHADPEALAEAFLALRRRLADPA